MVSPKPQEIGSYFFNLILYLRGLFEIFLSSLEAILFLRKSPVRTVLFKQIYFTGIEALKSVVILGALIGIVIITQISSITGLGSEERTGKILIWVVVRELGPLFTATIIIARSGTAIAAELGSMKVGQEIKSLEALGINPMAYLIMPRIVGVTLAVILLTFYFELTSIFGGLGIASLFWDLPFGQHAKTFLSSLSFFEILVSTFKSLIFGLIISTVSCYQGLKVGQTITQIPQAATKAVMQSLFMVFIFDGIITLMAFL